MFTYEGLRKVAQENGGLYSLKKDKIIGNATIDAIREDSYVSLRSLEKVIKYYEEKSGNEYELNSLIKYIRD